MIEKRYYKKDWEESYYIFDSNTISEDEFEERVEYDGYDVFRDSLTVSEIIDLLNENEELKRFKEDVFNKIDMYLQMFPTIRNDEINGKYGVPKVYKGAIEMLETLKKELKE